MSLIPKKGTVYVVDDDEAVRDSLQWLLEGKDYRVKCFDSAESFLSRFDSREVACLLVDIRMDGMSGLELQDRLIERKSPLPVVFITGHGDVPMAVTTMKKGAMDFIEKPFKEDELLGLVEKMLDQARNSFANHQEQASRDALLSRLTTREALDRARPSIAPSSCSVAISCPRRTRSRSSTHSPRPASGSSPTKPPWPTPPDGLRS